MNEKNLIPLNNRTKNEQREIQSKGGKASGAVRSFKSALKKRLKDNPKLFDSLIDMLTDEALDGNLRAMEMLLDLNGESIQRELLSLKKKELKMKEEAVLSSKKQNKEEPMLYKALMEEDS